MKMKFILISILAGLAIALAACGGPEETGGPTVVATTGVVADLAEGVAGRAATVEQLIPDGASPHDFSLSAEDRLALENADLVVAGGAGLEAGIPLEGVEAPTWELAGHVRSPLPFAEEEHAEDEEHGGEGEHVHEGHDESEGGDHAEEHEHEGDVDPHVWMDPQRVAGSLPSLAAALAAAGVGDPAVLRRRADHLKRRLEGLDREIGRSLEEIPPQRRKLVTSHDAFSYFADRYGFEVIATPFPASGPEAEPSAARLAEVVDAVERSGVPAVFAQAEDDPAVLQRVAEQTGVEVVTGLLVESPGDAGSYPAMLRRDAGLIAAGLKRTGSSLRP